MHIHTSRRLLAGLASVVLASSIVTTTTAAASPDTTQDCWILLDTGASVCVDQGQDLAEAVLDETGYTVVSGSDDAGTGTAARGTLVSYSLGTIHDDLNFGGGSYLFTTTDSAICAVGKVYGVSQLSSIGWNDRLSSFQGINGCRGVIFKDGAYSGRGYGPTGSSTYVGADFNDKASSIQWVH